MNNWADANVFIFDFNDNNAENVEHLKNTFKKFNCIVKTYGKLTKSEILEAAKEISTKDFTLFKYIVTIVLDNGNEAENVIRSSDGHDVMLHSEFLTTILENRKLGNKKLLFLLQINRNYPSDEDEEKYKNSIIIDNEKPIYASTKVYFYAVETSQFLPMQDDLFIKSFCKCFSEFGATLGIDKIHEKVYLDLERNGYKGTPVIKTHFQSEDRIFGYALSDEEIKDFYPDDYVENKRFV